MKKFDKKKFDKFFSNLLVIIFFGSLGTAIAFLFSLMLISFLGDLGYIDINSKAPFESTIFTCFFSICIVSFAIFLIILACGIYCDLKERHADAIKELDNQSKDEEEKGQHKMKTYYKLGKYEVFLTTDTYLYGHNTALNATCSDGEPYATLTVNPEFPLESPDLAYLKVNLYGIDVEAFITENGLGEKVEGREYKSGFVIYPLYRLNLRKIEEGVC